MSFGSRELDRAYDRWKTQSPEEHYGEQEEDAIVSIPCPICEDKKEYCWYCREEMSKKLTCPHCHHDQMEKRSNYWRCNNCRREFSSDQLFSKKPISLSEVTSDKIKELRLIGRYYEATQLLLAYKQKQKYDRIYDKKEYYKSQKSEYQSKRRALLTDKGLCVKCGNNHTTNGKKICESCHQKNKKYEKQQRSKNMENNEQKNKSKGTAKILSFIPSSKEAIPTTNLSKSSEFTEQARKHMLLMSVGSVLKIPIGDTLTHKEDIEATKKKYSYSCREAGKKLNGEYKVYERLSDVYIERIA